MNHVVAVAAQKIGQHHQQNIFKTAAGDHVGGGQNLGRGWLPLGRKLGHAALGKPQQRGGSLRINA